MSDIHAFVPQPRDSRYCVVCDKSAYSHPESTEDLILASLKRIEALIEQLVEDRKALKERLGL